MKIKVQNVDDETATILLPALPEGMDWSHFLIFTDSDKPIFGLGVHRYADGHVGVEVQDPDSCEAVCEHEFKE